jgi:hypothetical protein
VISASKVWAASAARGAASATLGTRTALCSLLLDSVLSGGSPLWSRLAGAGCVGSWAEWGPAGAAFASGSAAAASSGAGSEGSIEVHEKALVPLAPLVLDWTEVSDSLVGLPSIPAVSGVLRTVPDKAFEVSPMY